MYGEFPKGDSDAFIESAVVDDAMARPAYKDVTAPLIMGVDPAGTGVDGTSVVLRRGRDLEAIHRFKCGDTMQTVGELIALVAKYAPDMVVIDVGGLGAGIHDRMKEQRVQKLRGVNFAWASGNKGTWANKRAEMWGEMRAWLRDAHLPNDQRLRQELTSPGIKRRESSGAILLESKHEMRSRGVASPDTADALAVTFAFPFVGDIKGGATPRTGVSFAPRVQQLPTSGGWLMHV